MVLIGTAHDEDQIVRHLFTLGEVVQLCPGKLPKRVFLLVQSMIATPCITTLPASQSCPESHQSETGSQESEVPSSQQSKPAFQNNNQSQTSTHETDQSQPLSQPDELTSQQSHDSSPELSQGEKFLIFLSLLESFPCQLSSFPLK